MNNIPTRASAVIIGAGMVGISLPISSCGSAGATSCSPTRARCATWVGSTGHASNFILPIEYSQIMELTADSTRRYKELGVHPAARDRVARTEARMHELHGGHGLGGYQASYSCRPGWPSSSRTWMSP